MTDRKCVLISCFDHYPTRMESMIGFFGQHNCETTYIISDYAHYEKKRYTRSYPDTKTVQLHVPAYKKNISLNRLISHYVFSVKLLKQLKKEKPDIVYCNFPPNSLLGKIEKYKSAHPCKVILDCYDKWPESFPYSDSTGLLRYPFAAWAALRDRHIQSADLIISVSDEGRESLLKISGSVPVAVLRPALSAAESPEYTFDADEQINFLYLGNVNHIIDINLGAEFLAKMSALKKTVLHIIGGGQFLDEFVQRVRESGVEVICHGVIFDIEKKKEIFAKCHMGLNIPQRKIHSTMPLKAVEYMRLGLPFINTGIGNIRDLVSERGIGYTLDPDAIQDACEWVCGLSRNELQQMSANCQETYRDKFMDQDYEGVFSDILGNDGGEQE